MYFIFQFKNNTRTYTHVCAHTHTFAKRSCQSNATTATHHTSDCVNQAASMLSSARSLLARIAVVLRKHQVQLGRCDSSREGAGLSKWYYKYKKKSTLMKLISDEYFEGLLVSFKAEIRRRRFDSEGWKKIYLQQNAFSSAIFHTRRASSRPTWKKRFWHFLNTHRRLRAHTQTHKADNPPLQSDLLPAAIWISWGCSESRWVQ